MQRRPRLDRAETRALRPAPGEPPREPPREPDDLGELTCDAIAGTFRVVQRKRGHRYSIDDVMTAYVAAEAKPQARRCLDLGSGIGSVLLMLCYKLPDATFLAIEAQRNSFRLLQRNIAENGLATRVSAYHDDLRTAVVPALGSFDLVTGTPPYVAPQDATPSTDAQRAYARQEWRGGVEDYIAAGAKVLAPEGRLIVCGDARSTQRVEQAALRSGLAILAQHDVVPRASRPPLFTVFDLGPSACGSSTVEKAHTFTARDAEGRRTEAYHVLREYFGMTRPQHEP